MASTRSFLCVVSVAVALTDAGSAAQDVNAILRTVDVSTIVPIHGAVVAWGDFIKHMGMP